MTRPASYLGIDLGTSGLKVALLREDGHLVAEGEAAYQVLAPRTGWAETDPAVWWSALGRVVEGMSDALRAHELEGIGLAGQMHGVVLCDRAGTPSRPAILWPDRRSQQHLTRWHELSAADRARLSNPIVPGMFGPILSWLAENEPSVVARAAVALLPKDVVRVGLTGDPCTDRSDASATLLWDVTDDGWARDIAARTGVPDRLLPPVVASDQVAGVTSWLAKTVGGGGPDDVPVVAGGGDTPVAMLAAGSEGLHINLGTGAQVLMAGVEPHSRADPDTHLYGDTEGGWYAMAAVQNAGLALDWVMNVLGLSWADLVTVLAAPAPRQGVSFLPFLTGERGALAQPDSRAAWLGLDQATTRDDLARAAVEAMVFTVRRAVELLPAVPAPTAGPVCLTGGGGREPAVQQLLADVLGREVQRVEVRSSSATGAAVLAARGTGGALVPQRRQGPVVSPRRAVALGDAYERWLNRVPVADA